MTSRSKKIKKGKFVFEATLCVEDYMKGPFKDSPEIGFDMCREDYPAALQNARAEIREVMGWGRIRKGLDLRVISFLEFDSSNWSHATGYFDVEVSGPADMVGDIEKTYEKAYE